METDDRIRVLLGSTPRRFLVTGAAGFIGSHLVETLLRLGQCVVGLDNFTTGTRSNLSEALGTFAPGVLCRFRFVEGDIRDPSACADAMQGVDIVLHQAALASVPRSIEDPESFHSVNVDGFRTLLASAHAGGAERIVFASSSSVYGDDTSDEKLEERIGRPLSPYAATKQIDEIEAAAFQRIHDTKVVGLRYFNVFGPRQNPAGPYAAVIPRWIENLLHGDQCVVFGDGSASRDFCFVDNVVQANIRAACLPDSHVVHDAFNVACGEKTRLLELFDAIRSGVSVYQPSAAMAALRFDPPRPGDIPHSLASIRRARSTLGYEPSFSLWNGLSRTIAWYVLRSARTARSESHGTTHA
jgi:UDP-N-acetylglucosamine/UDP-N-acetylgalactosamine 4-epimerase